jgi:hypothetical protein
MWETLPNLLQIKNALQQIKDTLNREHKYVYLFFVATKFAASSHQNTAHQRHIQNSSKKYSIMYIFQNILESL